jgi:hypothetical protein
MRAPSCSREQFSDAADRRPCAGTQTRAVGCPAHPGTSAARSSAWMDCTGDRHSCGPRLAPSLERRPTRSESHPGRSPSKGCASPWASAEGFSGSRLWPLPNAARGRRVRRITEQRRGRLPMPWRSREPSLHVEHHHPIRELWMSVMNGASGSRVLPAGRWSVDATRSSVAFAVRHTALAPVNGRFQEFDGALEIGSGTPRATGVVRAAAIDTDEPIRAEHLRRSRDFEQPHQLPSRNGTLALRGRRYARGRHRADRVT